MYPKHDNRYVVNSLEPVIEDLSHFNQKPELRHKINNSGRLFSNGNFSNRSARSGRKSGRNINSYRSGLSEDITDVTEMSIGSDRKSERNDIKRINPVKSAREPVMLLSVDDDELFNDTKFPRILSEQNRENGKLIKFPLLTYDFDKVENDFLLPVRQVRNDDLNEKVSLITYDRDEAESRRNVPDNFLLPFRLNFESEPTENCKLISPELILQYLQRKKKLHKRFVLPSSQPSSNRKKAHHHPNVDHPNFHKNNIILASSTSEATSSDNYDDDDNGYSVADHRENYDDDTRRSTGPKISHKSIAISPKVGSAKSPKSASRRTVNNGTQMSEREAKFVDRSAQNSINSIGSDHYIYDGYLVTPEKVVRIQDPENCGKENVNPEINLEDKDDETVNCSSIIADEFDGAVNSDYPAVDIAENKCSEKITTLPEPRKAVPVLPPDLMDDVRLDEKKKTKRFLSIKSITEDDWIHIPAMDMEDNKGIDYREAKFESPADNWRPTNQMFDRFTNDILENVPKTNEAQRPKDVWRTLGDLDEKIQSVERLEKELNRRFDDSRKILLQSERSRSLSNIRKEKWYEEDGPKLPLTYIKKPSVEVSSPKTPTTTKEQQQHQKELEEKQSYSEQKELSQHIPDELENKNNDEDEAYSEPLSSVTNKSDHSFDHADQIVRDSENRHGSNVSHISNANVDEASVSTLHNVPKLDLHSATECNNPTTISNKNTKYSPGTRASSARSSPRKLIRSTSAQHISRNHIPKLFLDHDRNRKEDIKRNSSRRMMEAKKLLDKAEKHSESARPLTSGRSIISQSASKQKTMQYIKQQQQRKLANQNEQNVDDQNPIFRKVVYLPYHHKVKVQRPHVTRKYDVTKKPKTYAEQLQELQLKSYEKPNFVLRESCSTGNLADTARLSSDTEYTSNVSYGMPQRVKRILYDDVSYQYPDDLQSVNSTSYINWDEVNVLMQESDRSYQ